MAIVSTKGRYAIRVLLDLAEHRNGAYIPMKEVAERQDISLKYLEKILPVLAKNNLIKGVHGKGGGYMLTREPEDYKIGEILRLTEGDIAPVACLQPGAEPCEKASECRTLPMWSKFNDIINEYFDGITLRDLMKTNGGNEYII
ncbi:MAG: RrF2 family transcriptional regulator [Lachnospiraceae bacterium]|nr:RrF2 family transcriptional regulator [Lachnospiraceae bacterium]